MKLLFYFKCPYDCKIPITFSQVIPRNYELEELLYSQKAKMKPTKDNLLKAADEESQSYQIAAQKFEPKIEAVEEDEDAGGIRDKARAVRNR